MESKRSAAGAAKKRTTPHKGSTSGRSGKKKQPLTPKARALLVLKWGTISGLSLVVLMAAAFVVLYQTIDIPDPNEEFLDEQSTILYDDGSNLGTFARQKRDVVALDEMSDYIKEAVVAAENRSFWTDSGIDPRGILRAAFSNASGNSTQGASTITQQYVKLLYLTQERSYTRKVKEAILSLKVQRKLSKQAVLHGYLNTIYFGRGAYGIQTAAEAFFNKSAKRLGLRESAVLASVLNNPTGYDPANGKEARQNLKERYEYVLNSMAELNDITEQEAEKAKRKLPKFPPIKPTSTFGDQKGHLLTMVRQELLRTKDKDGNFFTEEQIDGGGLEVTTTFNPKVMDAAEQGVIEARPEGFGDKELHVGVASVEPGTGAVRGIYAGQDFLQSQINWALAGGQAGSTFKAFAVAAGLKDGFALKDVFDGNSPYELSDGSEVENQGDSSYGSVSLLRATEDSINTAFIDMTLAMDDGPEKIIKMANAMGVPPAKAPRRGPGFPNETPGLLPNTGVALGSQTVSPINMANGYATIANGGVAMAPYIIEKVIGSDGEKLYEHKSPEGERAVSEDIAADTSYALQQVVESGSGFNSVGSVFDRPAAGKTGTATKTGGAVSSSWYTGYTPQLSTAVMYVRGTGNDQLDGWLPEFFGGTYPAQTWTAVMTAALEGEEIEEFPEPAYVDGEAPSDGHEYIPPPPPPPKKTKTPSLSTEDPTDEPSGPTDRPEPTRPTNPTEPTEAPSPTQPTEPTNTCPPIGGCPQESPQSPGGGASPRTASATSTEQWWMRWLSASA